MEHKNTSLLYINLRIISICNFLERFKYVWRARRTVVVSPFENLLPFGKIVFPGGGVDEIFIFFKFVLHQ